MLREFQAREIFRITLSLGLLPMLKFSRELSIVNRRRHVRNQEMSIAGRRSRPAILGFSTPLRASCYALTTLCPERLALLNYTSPTAFVRSMADSRDPLASFSRCLDAHARRTFSRLRVSKSSR